MQSSLLSIVLSVFLAMMGSFWPFSTEAATFASLVRGRVLIDVDQRGEAWYVSPTTLQRKYLDKAKAAAMLLTTKALGITHQNLLRIRIAPDSPMPPNAASAMVFLDVPYTPQAPFGEWSDRRQQEGCEEASALMAVRWARGETLTLADAKKEILAMSDEELNKYGSYVDTSAQDTLDRLIKGYLGYTNADVRYGISTNDIVNELRYGNVVIAPVNGQKLHDPNFSGAGPLRHMIVVIGYDPSTDQFIVNEPGTTKGRHTRYSRATLESALRDYPSGDHAPITENRTAMITVRPSR